MTTTTRHFDTSSRGSGAPSPGRRPNAGSILLIVALVTLSVAAPRGALALAQSASPAADYLIGGRDLLEIRVFDVDQLDSNVVRVTEEGMIRLPLVGLIEAAGRTRTELETAIERALTRYVTDPQVSVFIREYESQRFSIMGAVRNAGTYEISGRTSLLEAISQAGGINEAEASGTVTILSADPTGVPREIDMDRLLTEGTATYNVEVQGGDTINVVSKDRYSIYIYGRVRAPGAYELREQVTLLQAISLAGGVADRAKKDKVRIRRRRADGTQETIEINLEKIVDGKEPDVEILANDVIIVPETWF